MNMMWSKAMITIYFLVCVGVCLQTTEGSLLIHPYRFHHLWPDFDTFEDDFFSDPFFRDPFDWEPFRDDRFVIDFPVFRKPATGSQRNCQSRLTASKSSEKASKELRMSVDVKGFAPQELTLVTKGNDVIIKGEKNVCDSTSCYTRSLCWRKRLPQDIEMNTVKARLTKDDTVEITAEKKNEIEAEPTCERKETQEILRQQNLEKQDETKPSDPPTKEDITTIKSQKLATKEEVEEETTLEVENDDDQ